MIERFEFATAGRVIFGPGALKDVAGLAAEFGKRALVITGRSTARAVRLEKLLETAGVSCVFFPIVGEPTTHDVHLGVRAAREQLCNFIIGFGGGSALDAAKAIAALLTNEGELLDYLEVIGQGKALKRPAAPCLAIPTTAGTGTEVTRNAVLASPEHRFKVSLRGPQLLPRVALIDPELTYELPPALTASTGLDALTQLIEPFLSIRANPLTDAICLEGMRRAARSLPRAYADGRDTAARADMCVASLFGGFALANAGLGAVHGFAAPIGGMFPAPHGEVCAALLPHALEVNLQALRQRAPDGPALPRFDQVARLLTGRENAKAEDGLAWVRELCGRLQIRPLRHHRIAEADFPELITKAAKASSMKNNPIVLTEAELTEILRRAW